jgi:hypothetical protein
MSKVSIVEHESIIVLRQMVADWQEQVDIRDARIAEQLLRKMSRCTSSGNELQSL